MGKNKECKLCNEYIEGEQITCLGGTNISWKQGYWKAIGK
jgi:hypothetical protein